MNFNKFVKLLLSDFLAAFDFMLKDEVEGLIEYENKLLIISFSYDFRVSFEVDMIFTFKSTCDFYTYSEIKQCLYREENTYVATQIIKDDQLNLWVEKTYVFLQENLRYIINNHVKIGNELRDVRTKNVDRYSSEVNEKIFIYNFEKFWRDKDYSKLVEIFEKYRGKISESTKKKYEYAFKNASQKLIPK